LGGAQHGNLYANIIFADKVQCTFDSMIEPKRQISVPISCGPSHCDFQRGWQEASVLQKFLEAHQKCPLIYVEPLIYVARFTPKMSVRWHIYLHQCPWRRQKSELQTRPNNGLGRRRRHGFGTILENMSYPRRCLWHKEGRRIGVAECLSRISRSWQLLCGGGGGGGGGGDRGTVDIAAAPGDGRGCGTGWSVCK